MRSWNVARNALVGMACQILMLLLAFVVRTIFIRTLSEEYLGLTSLFASVLDLLNLSELGLSTAIIYALYQPIAEHDVGKIVSLMRFYRNAYRVVGLAVLLMGLLFLPYMDDIIHTSVSSINIYLVYVMYLAQAVFSFWFFAYKSVLLTASQNEFLVSFSTSLSKMTASVLQIFFLWTLQDMPETAFYVFVGIGIMSNLGVNFIASMIVDRRFPFINQEFPTSISSSDRKAIFKNVLGSAIYRVCNAVNTSVSNILISAYVNLASVGLYANYMLLHRGITTLLGALYRPFTASIGNLNVLESNKRKEFIFDCLHLLTFWVSGICGVGMWVLYNPFVGGVWLDRNWLLSHMEVSIIVLRFWMDACMGPVIWFREAAGLFWKARYRYLMTLVVNLSTSIYFLAVLDMGILGVLVGALLSDCVRIIIDPIIVFSEVFQKPPWEYYRAYIRSVFLAIGTAIIVQEICSLWDSYSVLGFSIAVLACFMLPNLFWWLLFHRTREYQYLTGIVKTIVREKLLVRLQP